MENYLTQIINYLLTQSWQIAALVVVIAGVNLALKNKSAHVRYLLWLIVLAKCLVPPLFTVPLAVLPEEKTSVPVPISLAQMPTVAFEVVDRPAVETTVSPAVAVSAPTVTEKAARLNSRQWLGFGWVVGVAAFFLFAVIKALRTNFWLGRQRKPIPIELRSWIENLFSGLGIKTLPRVWLVEGIGQPFVWGLLRGSIYLPADFVKVNSAEHRRSVLGHELSHIVRFDAAVNILQILAQAVFWFHPFVWWANKKIRAEREKCCDEMAIARLDAKTKDYSSAIVNILISEHESTRPVPSLAVAGPVRNIEERIKIMLKPGKKFYKHASLSVAILIVVIGIVVIPTTVVLTAAAQEIKASPQKAEQPAQSLVKAALAGDVAEVKRLIAAGADVNLFDHLRDERVKVSPLCAAAMKGHADIVQILLEKGADVKVSTSFGYYSPLFYAIWSRDEQAVRALVSGGADVNRHPPDERDSPPLIYAIWEEQVGLVRILLDAGADVNAKNKDGTTALYCAAVSSHKDILDLILARTDNPDTIHMRACQGDVDRIKALIREGMSVDVKDEYGCTPLHWAVLADSPAVAEYLIGAGADVNAQDKNGFAPILVAQGGDMIQLLIRHRAIVNIKNTKWGATRLHLECASGDTKNVEMLLAAGADVNAKNKRSTTPLHRAALLGHYGTVKLLIEKGADVNVKDARGRTPLAMALEREHTEVSKLLHAHGSLYTLHDAAKDANIDEIKRLLSQGTDVNVTNEEGQTPLHKAARAGQSKVTQLLISRGADINATSKAWESTPLHCTANKGRANVAELLLAKGAKLELRNFNGQTPLHLAAFGNQPKVADLLLAHGADIEARTVYDRTPLGAALHYDHPEMVEFLLDRGANIHAKEVGMPLLNVAIKDNNKKMVTLLMKKGLALPPIHQAAFLGELDKVKAQIDKGVNIDLKDTGSFTPLFCAICGHHKEMVGFLLDKGADVDAQAANGWFPLSYAKIDIAKLLVAKGANVMLKGKTGQTVLHWAVNRNDYQGDMELVKLYVSRGADVNAKGYSNCIRWEGWTPFHVACRNGNKAVVELLISNGANINAKTDKGYTPLSLAEEKGRAEVVELLRRHGAKE